MPGTTGAFGWPFPTGSDRVMDGDNAIAALAEAIEDSLSMLRPQQKGSSADLTLGVANVQLPSLTLGPFTPLATEIWVVIMATFFHATTAGYGDCTASLYLDGVSQGDAQYSPNGVPDRSTVTQVYLFSAPAAVAHSIAGYAKCSAAGGVVKARAGSTITLMRFPMPTTGALLRDLADRDQAEALPGPEVEK